VAAVDSVSRLRAEHPGATADQLADRLISRCTRDLAVGGAVAGGAAASPVAGVAAAAATTGADATYSIGRLSEMIMGIGLIYGHPLHTVDERTALVVAVLGLSESAAVGLTGLAARIGSRSGARLLAKLPTGSAPPPTAGVTKKAVSKLSNSKGPWSLAALVPYGIGAGVGAAGNTVLARSVGKAAKQYFSGGLSPEAPSYSPVTEDGGEGEIVDEPAGDTTNAGTSTPGAGTSTPGAGTSTPGAGSSAPGPRRPSSGAWDDEIVDAEIVVDDR